MKTNYLFITCIAFCLCLQSCMYGEVVKPPPNEPYFTALPKDIKDYCVFKYGSYWIYQDSVSGAFDTVTLQSHYFDTVDFPKVDDQLVATNETFKIELLHSFDGYTDGIRPFALTPPPPYNGNDNFHISIWRYKPGNVLGETSFLLMPYSVGSDIVDYLDTIRLVYKSDEVLFYHHSKHPCFYDSPVDEVFKRNIGVYRREVKKVNQVWKLIDYQIYQ